MKSDFPIGCLSGFISDIWFSLLINQRELFAPLQHIFLKSAEASLVEIIYGLGQVILKSTEKTAQLNFQTDKMQDGIYFIKVTQNNCIQARKIVVQH